MAIGYKLRDEDGKVRTDHNGKCERCYIDYETAEEYYEHKCPRVPQGNEQKLKKKDGKEQAHKGRKAPSKHEEAQSVRGSEEEGGGAYELSGSDETPQREETDESTMKGPAEISRAGGEPMSITESGYETQHDDEERHSKAEGAGMKENG